MSTPMSKGKIAGFALLGVAAVTGVMGVATATSGGSNTTNTAEQPSGQQSPNAPVPPAPSEPSSSGSAPSSAKPSASATAAPPTTKVVEAPKPGQADASKRLSAGNSANPAAVGNAKNPAGANATGKDKSASVRVYNNGTVKGLASRAAADIRGKGYKVVSVNNYSSGTIPATTVYFRPGTEEEATAKSLASDIGVQAQPRFEGIQKSSPGVIVIVTNDYRA